ncbi:hypothetical protein P886_0765 [Alteromonadaceae bacterium 2753L.S.0a.02]|nr:hypothetical protein P886_0765 [Alteromonadaceae bacterium 2753L.S.0a.02]
MQTLISTSNRLDYLDGVRAFALLLGIVFHASLSFMPIYIGWAVMDVSTSSMVSVFMNISHSFRMELFFLIAGFFSHMTFHGKGAQTFIRSRVVRIAIPFVVAWFVLRPLLVSCWIMGAESLRGEPQIIAALAAGFASLGQLPAGLFTGSHLWFLYYLLLISGFTLVLRYLMCLYAPVRKKMGAIANKLVGWLCRSAVALVAIAIPTAACLWAMSHWGVDTPDKTLLPMLPVLVLYGGFFGFGWLLHREPPFIAQFARLSWSKSTLCLCAIVATTQLAGFEYQQNHAHYLVLKAAYLFSYALMMWTLVSLTIGLFKRFLSRPSKIVRYIADASYWLYLIHLPIVIWLQIAFAELALHWSIKLVAVSLLTLLIALVLYDLVVRATFMGKILNGKRKARVLFSFGRDTGMQQFLRS